MLPPRRLSLFLVVALQAGCAGNGAISKPPIVPAQEDSAYPGREIPVTVPMPSSGSVVPDTGGGGVASVPVPARVEPLPVESLPDQHNVFPLPGAATLPVEAPAPQTEIPLEAVSDPMMTGESGSPGIPSGPDGMSPPVMEPSPPVQAEPPPPPLPPVVSPPGAFSLDAPPAVLALETDIQKSMTSGHYGDAAATLERAIRIQPKNPELWHVLARVRLKQGQPGLAVDLARKSNLLARSHAELIRSNWDIIAQALRIKGDPAGAAEAQRKAGGW